MLFLGSPDVNAEFHTLDCAADFGTFEFGDVENISVEFFIVDY